MRAVVVLNGERKDERFLRHICQMSDAVICADGGYNHLKTVGITPDAVVGDLDSVTDNDICCGEICKYPAEKDWTDGELAIDYAIKHGADEIVLTCALGGRKDHELSNVFLLSRFCNVQIIEPTVRIFCVDEAMRSIKCGIGKTVSVVPVCDSVVTLNGFRYNVQSALFPLGTTLGMSNVVESDFAQIQVHSGKVLVFEND